MAEVPQINDEAQEDRVARQLAIELGLWSKKISDVSPEDIDAAKTRAGADFICIATKGFEPQGNGTQLVIYVDTSNEGGNVISGCKIKEGPKRALKSEDGKFI